jgi:hypothetical protein
MMSFHRSRRSVDAASTGHRNQHHEPTVLSVEASPSDPLEFYAELGFRPPSR